MPKARDDICSLKTLINFCCTFALLFVIIQICGLLFYASTRAKPLCGVAFCTIYTVSSTSDTCLVCIPSMLSLSGLLRSRHMVYEIEVLRMTVQKQSWICWPDVHLRDSSVLLSEMEHREVSNCLVSMFFNKYRGFVKIASIPELLATIPC